MSTVAVHLPFAPPTLRILVVDDHCVVRDGITLRIEAEQGMSVVGCVATGEEAIAAAERLRPDVVIMDLVLPDLNGIEATRRILHEYPKTLVIALSACHSVEHVRRALRAGATAYVVKSAGRNDLTDAIKCVVAGTTYFSREILALHGSVALQGNLHTDPIEKLSDRERQILLLLTLGSSSAEIARRLSLSCKTVETYRSRMMAKLGVSDRTALIRISKDYELPEA